MTRPPELESGGGDPTWGIITAAEAGDVDALRRLLERDRGLARSRYSPLVFAVFGGHREAVEVLVEAGADANQVTFLGDSLIEIARERGYHDVVAVLERACSRLPRVAPAESHADHPIHLAAESGHIERVRALLDEDPSLVHLSDRAGGTPLHRAVVGHALSVVGLLLDRGADIHAVHGAGLGSSGGYAPADSQAIDLAIWGGPSSVPRSRVSGLIGYLRWNLILRWRTVTPTIPYDVGVARLLIARGAAHDITIAAALGDRDRVATLLRDRPDRIRESRPNGRRPLSAAVQFDHHAIVRLLLERGADPTWPDADGSSRGAALHAAARKGDRAMVELLLAHGADPNAHVDAAGNATFAAKTHELRATLMAHGGRVDPYDLVWMGEEDEVLRAVTENPQSALGGCGGVLTAVCRLGKRDLLIRLLNAGVRVPPVAGGCQSYLLETPDMLETLLAFGLSPDYPTWRNSTLLHALCSRDVRNRTMDHRTLCAKILLDAGAAVSAKDDDYRSTPLAWASRNNLPDMVDFLIARGAPTNLADDEPWATPLAWATRRGHKEIVDRLRAAGAQL